LLQIRNALNRCCREVLEIRTRDSSLKDDLGAWCRLTQNEFVATTDAGITEDLPSVRGRCSPLESRIGVSASLRGRGEGSTCGTGWSGVRGDPEEAPTYYGFVPEAPSPSGECPNIHNIERKLDVWADNVQDLYEQAKSKRGMRDRHSLGGV